MSITVSQINIYPIKSTTGISLEESLVQKIGLFQDRRRAVVLAETNKILTARECPKLLSLSTQFIDDELVVSSSNSSLRMPISLSGREMVHVKLWANESHPGVRFSKQVDDWFSEQLNLDCYLIFMDENCRREFPKDMASGYEGLPEDAVSYADDYPILLASTATGDLDCA
ncbi:MAG: MOSC N-terminal beta barrel domain-containing protein [Anaerolineales bacterium]